MKKQFDRFILTDLIAQGPGGALYHGQEQLPGGVTRPVRVKVLPAPSKADPNAQGRFIEEVRVLAALAAHPNVVTFYGMGISEGTPWVAMEHAVGTLAALIGQNPAAPADVARLIEHVARGLAAIHGLQPARLHNRLNAANVLAMDGKHFKITEFGLAAPVSAEPTLSADSARYAAPELLSAEFGPHGPPSDLYALGHLAYEFALGSKLHKAQFPAVADASADLAAASPARWQAWHHSLPTVLRPVADLIPGFPVSLSAVIARLTAKPLNERFASAGEVLATLGAGAGFEPPPPPPPPATPSAGGGFQRTFGATASRFGSGATAAPATPSAAPARTAPPPAPKADAGPGGRYYLKLRNQVTGPFDVATLQRMVRQGQVSRLHQVSTDQRTWMNAGSVEGLF
jgi:serine/threonine protein kinase